MDHPRPEAAAAPQAVQRLYQLYLWVLPALTLTLAISVTLAVRSMYDRSETQSRIYLLLDSAATLTEWSGDLAMLVDNGGTNLGTTRSTMAKTLAQLGQALAELQQVDQQALVYPLVAAALQEYLAVSAHFTEGQHHTTADSWYQERFTPAHSELVYALGTASNELLTQEKQRWRDDFLTILGLSLLAIAVLTIMISRFVRQRRESAVMLGEQRILRRSEERLRTLIRNSMEVLTLLSPSGEVLYSSPAVKSVLGYEVDEVIGRSAVARIHPDDREGVKNLYRQVAQEAGRTSVLMTRVQHRDGSWREVEVILTNLLDDANVSGILLTYRDVTERQQVEAHMLRLAYHDTLTDLPNRAYFRKQLDRALEQAEQLGTAVALLFMDLDNFKVINDSVGHQVGDRLLVVVAERIRNALGTHDTAGRLGGDEFLILAQQVVSERDVLDLAEAVARAVSQPMTLEGHEVTPSCSIGVALRQPGHDSADSLLRNADTAMYKAKAAGRQKIVLFEEWMNRDARDRLELEIELRKGLEREEFLLHFQPCVDLRTGEIREVEALVRWENPFRGRLAPGVFIPLAEETGLIHQLGDWVLEQACGQMKRWQEFYPVARDASVNVNVSVVQLFHPNFLSTVQRTLSETGLSPTSLRLEITESVIMHDSGEAVRILADLHALGISLAVDDFGKGYSNLRYLKRLPMDVLKVDRAFVEHLERDEQDAAIIKAIVTLAKTLHLRVTAEGVETAEQADILADIGCDLAQGYYFARPMPAEELEGLFETQAAD